MAREIRVPGGLTIRKTVDAITVLDHRPAFGTFTADMEDANGPTPGAFTVPAGDEGRVADLSELSEPGWVELLNMSSEYTVQWGIWDETSTTFFPVGELEPGHGAAFKLSKDFGERHDAGVGTGTAAGVCKLKFYSADGDAVVYVGAFAR